MTSEQKSRLAQGIVFGLFFLWLGDFMKECRSSHDAVKLAGKFVRVMGVLMMVWGAGQCFLKPRTKD